MNGEFLKQVKESLQERKQNLIDFMRQTSPDDVHLRTGSAGDEKISEELSQIETALLKADEENLGRCEICHEYIEENRLEMDYTACVCLDHLSGEERTRLENDLELSQKVQQALLPHALPEIREIRLAAFSQPAHIVGGDYFDFLKFKDGAHAIVIADVMGKGMAASMLMSNLQASLHILIAENYSPAAVIARLNGLFCHNIRLTKFVTIFLGRYDEATRTLTYTNAGHNPPLVLRKNSRFEELMPTGAAIGLIEQSDFSEQAVILQQGDRLFLYTDGLVESRNEAKELFGEDRLQHFIVRTAPFSPTQTIASLRETLHDFSGKKSPIDDTTVIVMDVNK